MMYCTNCGKLIPESSYFCSYCGAPVNSKNPAKQYHEFDSNNTANANELKNINANTTGDDKKNNDSYFIKHWKGKLSLAVSYWINNLLLNIILLILVTIIVQMFDFTNNPILPSILIIFLWLLVLILTPWTLIGLWRSAENHIKINNKYFWARVVQILVVIGWVQSIAVYVNTAIPQIIEFSKIALNKDSLPEYKIKILNNGNELEISGGIKFGLTDEVKKYFIQYPNIKVVHLNSFGGRITEAEKLSNFFDNKDLTTYSSRGCYSACVNIFMSGKYRVINENAKLGFHQPSFPGLTSSDLYEEIAESKRFYKNKGVEYGFVEKAFSTPHEDLWKPSNFELLQAGVIDKVVDGYNFSPTDLQLFSDIKKLESTLLALPVYQAIKTYEPEEFNKIIGIVNTSVRNGDTKKNMFAKTRAIAEKLLLKYIPYASDKLLLDFLELAREQTIIIYKMNPTEAYNFAMGTSRNYNLRKYFSKEIIAKELKLINDVIISGNLHPQKLPKEEDIEEIQLKVVLPLMRDFGEDISLFNKKDLTDLEKATAAKLLIRMYEIISELSYEEKTKYFRFTLSQSE